MLLKTCRDASVTATDAGKRPNFSGLLMAGQKPQRSRTPPHAYRARPLSSLVHVTVKTCWHTQRSHIGAWEMLQMMQLST